MNLFAGCYIVQRIKYAEDGYVIQPGDYIETSDFTGKKKHKVTRVTKTMALVRWNDVVEGKFPRIYDDSWFGPKPRAQWSTATYRVLIKE